MARKEKNTIDYFPHPVEHGRKMFYLRSKFKNDGYTVWFMLLEHLGKAEYHYLDLSDKVQLMYLSSEFMVSELVLNEIINILVDFNEFDKELWENYSILFNQKYIDNIEDAYKKRNNECISRNSLVSLLTSKGVIKLDKSNLLLDKSNTKGVGNTQTILKETILNNNRVFAPPTLENVLLYFKENGYTEISAQKAFRYYNDADWKDSKGSKVKNWKQKMQGVWFKDENKIIEKPITPKMVY